MKLTREHFRAMIFYDFKDDLTRQQCSQKLKRLFGDEAPSLAIVERCYNEFQRGCVSLKGEHRGGRPAAAITSKNIDIVRAMIKNPSGCTTISNPPYIKIKRIVCVDHLDKMNSKNKMMEDDGREQGFKRGLEADKILGSADDNGELMYLIQWKGTDAVDMVSAKEANAKCPQIVIRFYEDRITWSKAKAKV